MANGSISRTHFTRRGTNSSIPTAWAVGWSSLMPVATVGLHLTKTFSWKAAITEFIKFASKEAIPRAIPFVFREGALAVAGGLWAGRFSWDQSCHGMVVCCGARIAGTEARSSAPRAAANRLGHALSIGVIVAAVLLVRISLPHRALKIAAAAILFAFGLYRLFRSRHPNWVGMRVGFGDLTLWSFIMASAHGAGLMLVPFFLGSPAAQFTHQVGSHNRHEH